MSIPSEGPNPTTTPMSPASTSQYEFSPAQNVLIGSLASKMRFVGLFGLAIGILVLLPGIFRFDPIAIAVGVFYLLVALWTRSAGGSFRDVVDTQGADVSHLMNALESLRKLYTLTFWLAIVAIALLVVLLTAEVIGEREAPPAMPAAPARA